MASAVVILCLIAAIFYLLRRLFVNCCGQKDTAEGITNKYVLITGCRSGFGKEIAMRLDQLGFRVFATCRTKEGEDSLREVCSDNVKTFVMDVTDRGQVQEVFEKIKREISDDKGNNRNREKH